MTKSNEGSVHIILKWRSVYGRSVSTRVSRNQYSHGKDVVNDIDGTAMDPGPMNVRS